jgi:phosphatidylserine/phosphatidylglycerophosphate/cardiolipin synthase-like enzyme
VATFVPPVAGASTMSSPRRGVLDATGHRTSLIGRFSGVSARAVAPCRVFAKPIAVAGPFPAAEPAGERFWFVELTPLPSPGAAAAMRALGQRGTTMPRFFVGGPGVNATTPSGTIEQGQILSSGSDVYVGATVGTCALAPLEWARVLVEVMAGEAGLDAWTDFAALLGGPALYVLNHVGQVPAPNELSFDVDFGAGPPRTLAVDDAGDLQAVSGDSLFAPGVRIRMVTGADGIPFHTAYDSGIRSSAEPTASPDERWFRPELFADKVGTILCSDLDRWYGVRPPDVVLPRFHTGNHVMGLLDGAETFEHLRRDLDPLLSGSVPADGRAYGAWLASWAFKNFRLQPDDDLFVDLIKALNDRPNVSVRLLATKLVNFDGTETDEERRLMAIALIIATCGIDMMAVPLAAVIGKGVTVETGLTLTFVAALLIVAAHPLFIDMITDLLDGSKDVIAALTPEDPQAPRYALWSRYPSQFSDNPASSQAAGEALDFLVRLKRIGVWHSKMQLVAAPGTDSAPAYVGYLGGIDINDNRVESWTHRWPTDYHDIHARITGPAVGDLFQSFYERYAHEQGHRLPEDGPAAPNTCPCVVPKPGDADAILLEPIEPAGDNIVQIARTIYRPSAANAADAFWFAPSGEASVHDSVLRAIYSAREYIYIEDQFMAPPDSGGSGDEILEALVAAADRCKALILVFPEGTGDKQWMFGVERRNWLMGRLRDAWRLHDNHRFLPLIHARPLLDRTDHVASFRRTVLKDDITAGATQIRVVDGIRVPDAPSWAWISGELVLVIQKDIDTLSGVATLTVERGTQGRHLADSWARDHRAGAPVTFSRLDDVFIHAKFVLIDDVYASIGCANMSRRSMFHDGEISAQIVPGRLRAAAVNPVRDIRCRAWADHLGIPPGAATASLADPLEALPLFERTRAAGNLLVPYLLLDDMKPQGMAIERENAIQVLGTIFSGLGQLGGDLVRRIIYSTIVDPTTSLDPFFDADPFTGP